MSKISSLVDKHFDKFIDFLNCLAKKVFRNGK